jgi:hypothetical protein
MARRLAATPPSARRAIEADHVVLDRIPFPADTFARLARRISGKIDGIGRFS